MTDQPLYVELPPKFFLNQSRWKAYQDCDRYYAWNHVEGIEPERPRTALQIGTAIHKAMVFVNVNGGTKEAFAEATELAKKDYAVGMSSGPKLPGDTEIIAAGVDTIDRLLPAYFAHYGPQGQLWKPLGQELEFCVEVGEGSNVFLVGTIDNLVVLMKRLFLADYKTMGKMDPREFLKYEMDIQLTAYIYGGTKQLSLDAAKQGKPPVVIHGAIIDGLIKTKEPQFHREIYTRTVDELREFEMEFCMKAWEIAAKHSIVRGDRAAYNIYVEKMFALGSQSWKIAFPKNTQKCFQYGTCSFRELCAKDNATRRLLFVPKKKDYVDAARAKSDLSKIVVPEEE